MDLSRFNVNDTTSIAAPPDLVWAAVADITRMGQFSPVCTGGDWDNPAGGAAAGAWFTGHNDNGERTWSTRCQVEAAEPGQVFSFLNYGPSDSDIPLARWQFDLSPTAGGTEVKESWQVLDGLGDMIAKQAPQMNVTEYLEGTQVKTREGVATTLANLKESCEAAG